MNRIQRRQCSTRRTTIVGCWVVVITAAALGWIGGGERAEAFLQSSPPFEHRLATTTTTTTKLGSSTSSDADLLKDLPFLPEEVMAKFMKAVGDPLTAGSLQAGYQAGVVSEQELEDIQTNLPTTLLVVEAQSPAEIEAHWKAALEGQPWHVQAMGKLATPTIVPLVAKLQERSVRQAGAMKWINENALPLLRNNETIVQLLSSNNDNDDNTKLVLNNTRAKYETDRGVWSASMDVFLEGSSVSSTTIDENLSEASAALAALTETMDDDDDDLASFRGSVDVLESSSISSEDTSTTPSTIEAKIGLVNAYFVPDDEIKILVVEIDDVLHNVTWKGLD